MSRDQSSIFHCEKITDTLQAGMAQDCSQPPLRSTEDPGVGDKCPRCCTLCVCVWVGALVGI